MVVENDPPSGRPLTSFSFFMSSVGRRIGTLPGAVAATAGVASGIVSSADVTAGAIPTWDPGVPVPMLYPKRLAVIYGVIIFTYFKPAM